MAKSKKKSSGRMAALKRANAMDEASYTKKKIRRKRK
jgi:hypothetical protein